MKKISKILVALLLGIIMIFGVAGCNAGTQTDLQSKIDELQNLIAEMQTQIDESQTQIEEMENRLAEMDEELLERDATIEDLNDQIKERDERIEELEKELESFPETRTFIITDRERFENIFVDDITEFEVDFDSEMIIVYTFVAENHLPTIITDVELNDKTLTINYNIEHIPFTGSSRAPFQRWFLIKLDKLDITSAENSISDVYVDEFTPPNENSPYNAQLFDNCGLWIKEEFRTKNRIKGAIYYEDELGGDSSEEGALYSLQEAYDNGWLTREDLMSIAYYHNGGRRYNKEIMTEDYAPQPKTPEVLSEETQLKIKNAAAEEYRENYDVKDAEADGFTITQYCGTYGNCVVVMMRDIYSGSAAVAFTHKIAGVNIYYTDGRTLQVWR